MLKLERIKDFLLLEEEYVQNQERLKPQEERAQEERSRVDDLRGSPMDVGTLEEIIDDDHAIVSGNHGPDYYVSMMSFVDKDILEPGCSILMHHKVRLQDLGPLFARWKTFFPHFSTLFLVVVALGGWCFGGRHGSDG